MMGPHGYRLAAQTVMVGALLGLLIHLALPADVGLIPWRFDGASSADAMDDAIKESTALLGCYAASLNGLSLVVEQFVEAKFVDTTELKKVLGPFPPAIDTWNRAYEDLYRAKPRIMLQLLRLPRTKKTEDLVCGLKGSWRYQWEELRPEFNHLLVNIVAAWQGEIGVERLEEIRRQQQTEWLTLRARLVAGSTAFAGGDMKDACIARKSPTSPGP